MSKILYPSLIIISTVLVLVGAVFFLQTINKDSATAGGTVSYTETWIATGGVYGYVINPGWYTMSMAYANGVPGAGTVCGYGYGGYSTSYGFGSCQFSPSQWSVTGTINSGTAGVKRYFVSSNYAYYNYNHPTYGNLQTLTSSFCNGDAANPGGYFHPYLIGPSTSFAINGTTVQGAYGTGIAGQDNYLQSSGEVWLARQGQYGYLQSGKVLAGTTYISTDTYQYGARRILCVED